MFHEPPKNFLYSSYRVDARHTDSMGTVKEGIATGFVVEGKAGEAWFITNRHVVDLNYRQASEKFKDFKLAEFSITGRRADDSIYTFNLHSDARMFFHDDEENDVVVIEPRCVWEDIPENQRSLHWHFGREHFADELVFKESLQPFDVVCYAGFPDQHDKIGNRPILRSGHIASDPRYDYSWDSKPRGQCVAYEGFSFSGSSGSPVFAPSRGMATMPNSRHGYLIGINAGHLPNHPNGHSGISYFYKSTVITEILVRHGLA